MEDRVKVFKECWPYETNIEFTEDTVFIDIHSKTPFRVTDMRILRYKNRNVIVPPEYPLTGGMVVDLIYPETLEESLDDEEDDTVVIVSKISKPPQPKGD